MTGSLFDLDKDSRTWREEFVLRLRMRNVPGPQVGDALRTVEQHCADTGEPPRQAFGDAKEYADSLGLSRRTPPSTFAIALPSFFGAMLLATGVPGLLSGAPVTFTGADLAAWATVLAGSCGVIAVLPTRRSLVVGGVIAITCAVVLAVVVLWRDAPVLLQLSAWVATAVGLVLMAATVVFLRRRVREDRIADPISGDDMIARR